MEAFLNLGFPSLIFPRFVSVSTEGRSWHLTAPLGAWLPWLHRACPSATLDKSVQLLVEYYPEPSSHVKTGGSAFRRPSVRRHLDLQDLVLQEPRRHLDIHPIPDFFADEPLGNGRADGDFSLGEIRLFLAHQPVGFLALGL